MHLICVQAIAIAGCFMNEGCILVVCPAVLRYSWAEELERWLPCCLPSDIHLGKFDFHSILFLFGLYFWGWLSEGLGRSEEGQ